MNNLGNVAPVSPDYRKHLTPFDYYGSYDDYLMDMFLSGKKIPKNPVPPYCGRFDQNRNFLVNPVLTQQSLYVRPSLKYKGLCPYCPNWGKSAFDIRIGSEYDTPNTGLTDAQIRRRRRKRARDCICSWARSQNKNDDGNNINNKYINNICPYTYTDKYPKSSLIFGY